jgi:hypothetical protein
MADIIRRLRIIDYWMLLVKSQIIILNLVRKISSLCCGTAEPLLQSYKNLYNAIMQEPNDGTSHLECSVDVAPVLLSSSFLT